MSWFQLDPQSIADRVRAAGSPVPTLGQSLMRGIIGFTVVSVAGFVPWAVFGGWFRQHTGEIGMYVACAVAFIGLTGLLLHRLILGPGSMSRFYKLFGLSFALYSIAWIAGWMLVGKHTGSMAGLLSGTVVMGAAFVAAFEAKGELLKVIAALFVFNAIGYFIGGPIEHALIKEHPVTAKLLWGVTYGVGFGAGLGLAFHFCQTRARALLGR